MSYCRFGDHSDVYLYVHTDGSYTCCCCMLNVRHDGCYGESILDMFRKNGSEIPKQPFDWCEDEKMDTIGDVWKHLQRHIESGHLVPQYALDRVQEEVYEQAVDRF